MKLLLLADTHVPRRARDLPPRIWDEVAQADVVVHAGDWVEPGLLDELLARSARLVACWGNNDGPELRSQLQSDPGGQSENSLAWFLARSGRKLVGG